MFNVKFPCAFEPSTVLIVVKAVANVKSALPVIFNVSISAAVFNKVIEEALPYASTVNVFKAVPPLVTLILLAPVTLFTPRVAAVKASSKLQFVLY